MKVWGLYWTFAVILAIIFVSTPVVVKAMTVYAVDFVDHPRHENNVMKYVQMQEITPWINFIDASTRHPRFRVTNANLRFIYKENYGDDYEEFFYTIENSAEKTRIYKNTRFRKNNYETDLNDGHKDCNWNSRYSKRYNRMNNCYFD